MRVVEKKRNIKAANSYTYTVFGRLLKEYGTLLQGRFVAEYARQNPGVGRIQLICMSKDTIGQNQFKRLDMYRTAIRDKVSRAINTDALDHIFAMDGIIE